MQKLTIYIPADEEKSDHFIATALRGLAELSGGATVVYGQGAWLNQFHVLCKERIALVYTLAQEKDASKCKLFLQRLAREVKTGLNQEAVLVTVEDVKESILVS